MLPVIVLLVFVWYLRHETLYKYKLYMFKKLVTISIINVS